MGVELLFRVMEMFWSGIVMMVNYNSWNHTKSHQIVHSEMVSCGYVNCVSVNCLGQIKGLPASKTSRCANEGHCATTQGIVRGRKSYTVAPGRSVTGGGPEVSLARIHEKDCP